MKYLYHFFTLLSAMLIFSGCSDSSTGPDDSFEGQRFGNWVTTSETSAEWVGSGQNVKGTNQMAAAGDTTYFDRPNGNSLELHYFAKDGNQNDLFSIMYIDSSYSFAYFDTTEAASELSFYNPLNKEDVGGGMGVSDDYMDGIITISTFNCRSEYDLGPNDDFEFHILTDDGQIYESIVVDTDGVIEAMRAIGC